MQQTRPNTLLGAATVLLGMFACPAVFAQDAYPPVCEDTGKYPQFRQLDWLIGDWVVYAGEQKTAVVKVERRPGSCAYLETWAGESSELTANHPSVSYALLSFDLAAHLWNFYWVTGVIDLHYHFTAVPASQLVWERSAKSAGGGLKHERLTFERLADGSLKEQGVSSVNNGKNWTVDYSLIWRRKEG